MLEQSSRFEESWTRVARQSRRAHAVRAKCRLAGLTSLANRLPLGASPNLNQVLTPRTTLRARLQSRLPCAHGPSRAASSREANERTASWITKQINKPFQPLRGRAWRARRALVRASLPRFLNRFASNEGDL